MNGNNAPKDVRITIQVQGQKITTDPARPHVRRGDTLTWDYDSQWAVQFQGGQGPFADNDPERRRGDNKDGRIRGNPGQDAVRYKYAIAVYDGKDVYVEDPEVIVDPD